MLDMQYFSWTETAVITVASTFLWAVILAVYRLYFHPLASFPGPKIAAVTQWYEFYYDIFHGEGGQYTFKVDEMHQKYGPIVRVNPHELHVIDPEWHETLYGGPGQVRDKYPPAAAMAGVTMGTFGTIQHHQHRQRRSAITTLFSKKTVLSYEPLIRNHVEHLCQLIEKQCAEHGLTELRATYLAYSTDVVCDYFFGRPVGLLEDENAAVEWKETIEALAFFTPYAKQLTWLIPIAKRLPIPLVACFSRALAQAVDIFNDMNRRATSAYQSFKGTSKIVEKDSESAISDQSPRPPTVWNEILSSRLPDAEKLPFRMAEEGVVVIAAGSETVARTLNTATFHLLDTSSAGKALRDELKAAIPDPSNVPPIKELEQLPYLTAVIKESLRMASITMSRLPIISPQQPLRYKEWTIPAGTPVGMTPHKILMDPTIYTSPMEFQPERWLGSKEEVQRLNHFHVPFGKGNRICLGISVAQAELHLALATLFRRYEFELVDTIRERDVDVVRDCFVGEPSLKNQGIKMRIKAQLS